MQRALKVHQIQHKQVFTVSINLPTIPDVNHDGNQRSGHWMLCILMFECCSTTLTLKKKRWLAAHHDIKYDNMLLTWIRYCLRYIPQSGHVLCFILSAVIDGWIEVQLLINRDTGGRLSIPVVQLCYQTGCMQGRVTVWWNLLSISLRSTSREKVCY